MASLPLMARCCDLCNDVTSEGPRGDGEFASKEAGFTFGSLEQGAETAWNQRVDLGYCRSASRNVSSYSFGNSEGQRLISFPS